MNLPSVSALSLKLKANLEVVAYKRLLALSTAASISSSTGPCNETVFPFLFFLFFSVIYFSIVLFFFLFPYGDLILDMYV